MMPFLKEFSAALFPFIIQTDNMKSSEETTVASKNNKKEKNNQNSNLESI